MDYQYRKKPVVIEAFQMTEKRRRDNSEWPEWLNEAWQKHPTDVGCFYSMPESISLYIHTLEGDLAVTSDDWIIRGVQNELYPCKPDIFESTYEKV